MKKIKYLLLLAMAVATFNSCEEVDKEVYQIKDGINLATFENNSQTEAQIAATGDYDVDMKIKLTGASLADVSGDITVVVAVDDASTAVEGTHYSIESTTVVLKASNNYLGLLRVTMITDGIVTPLEVQPVLSLKIASATGDSNVENSGKLSNLTLSYACPSYLEGTYDVETVRGDAGVAHWTEYVEEIGIGTYLTEYVGTWNPPLNPDYGMLFTDVCGDLNVPQQDLADMYGNQVQSIAVGTVDDDTGVFVIPYSIVSSGWSQTYTSTYTPVK